MRGFVANTDFDWFTFLAARQPLEEVNFWGEQSVANGLLLRADIHRLFDAGYVTVTPDRRFVVSRRLADEWENGKAYYAMEGREIAVPARVADRPDPELLRWHDEQVFERGAA